MKVRLNNGKKIDYNLVEHTIFLLDELTKVSLGEQAISALLKKIENPSYELSSNIASLLEKHALMDSNGEVQNTMRAIIPSVIRTTAKIDTTLLLHDSSPDALRVKKALDSLSNKNIANMLATNDLINKINNPELLNVIPAGIVAEHIEWHKQTEDEITSRAQRDKEIITMLLVNIVDKNPNLEILDLF